MVLHSEFDACARAGLVGSRLEVVASPTPHMTPAHHAAPLPFPFPHKVIPSSAFPSATSRATSTSATTNSNKGGGGRGAAAAAAPSGPEPPIDFSTAYPTEPTATKPHADKAMGSTTAAATATTAATTAVAPGLAPTCAAALGLSPGLVQRALVVGRWVTVSNRF